MSQLRDKNTRKRGITIVLIRLCGHFKDNPNHIDKLIFINGLPEDWFFRKSIRNPGGKELVRPWEAEIDVNVPRDLKPLCEEHEVTYVFPPVEKGGSYTVDVRKIIGLKFDYMSEPGQVLWEKIERYLDSMTPRDQKVPEPVLVAPNHKSSFDPHAARRTVRGSLELYKTEIPVVNLTPVQPTIITTTSNVIQEPIKPMIVIQKNGRKARKPEELGNFKCEVEGCPKEFTKKSALRMHLISGHKKKEAPIEEPVSVGG